MRLPVILFCGTLLTLSPYALSHAQGTPAGTVGWYNGDWDSSTGPSLSNWYVSSTEAARVYDDFVVPAPGWTVIGVFSNNSLSSGAPQVTQASWEIRLGMSSGFGGGVVASGIGPTKPAYNSTNGRYRIEVDELQVKLPPGLYWVSVTPVTVGTGAYLCGTAGAGAIGDPPGNDGLSFVYSTFTNHYFDPPETIGAYPKDFSQGVLVAPPPIPESDQWRADLTSLVQQMETLHTVPFPSPGISMTGFNTNAANLYNQIPTLSDPQIRTGIQALVASIEDPHTDVGWGPAPFGYLPLTFYWFDDGMYIIGAPAPYQNLLGGMVTAVGQTDINAVTQTLTTLVPHENDQWPKYEIPLNKLPNTDFLFGTGITPDTSGAQITVQTPSGDSVSSFVAVPKQSVGPTIQVYQGALPLYRQHPDKHYWATIIDNGATVYFQYNSCTEDPLQPSADFLPQLNHMIAQDGVQRIVVDMRNNTGGSVSILNPWLESIRTSRFNSPGRLYVITGRATFSAAEATSDEFRDETAAIFVGEPTGGKPQFQVRISAFNLPYFGITASYSQGTWQTNDPGPTLVPDIVTGLTFAQYMAGDDPAMDAILSIPAN